LNQEFYRNFKVIETAGYAAFFYAKTGFIMVESKNREPGQDFRRDVGWKIQISIDDTDSERPGSNLETGWNIVVRHLMQHNVYCFKILPEGKHLDQLERGKQITIYAVQDNKSPEQWREILQTIEEELAAAQINPSYRPPASSVVIPGSHYFSQRNDDNGHGRYQPATEEPDPRLQHPPYSDIFINEVDRDYPNFWEWREPREYNCCSCCPI
jgi:hypothetical protein